MPVVQNRSELVLALQAHAAQIRSYGVERLGLFGSFVRDTATPASDVDLYVEFRPGQKTLSNLVGLSRSLEQLLGRKVELVTPQALNPFTGKYILQEVQYVALAA
jgi:predicted nucleotidyltransferase